MLPLVLKSLKNQFSVIMRVAVLHRFYSKLDLDDKCKKIKIIFTSILQIFVALKMSAYYVCCIHSNELQNTFTLEANTMNPDQSDPKVAV